MMIRKVISGGQTGADIAGVAAAKEFGLETGGTMPLGFRTELGRCRNLGKLYGFVESPHSSYADRTGRNVFDADATIRFASDFNSPGERLTLSKCRLLSKPHIDVPISNPPLVATVAAWIIRHRVRTLNVAGNRESTSPGIYEFVKAYLGQLFDELKKMDLENL